MNSLYCPKCRRELHPATFSGQPKPAFDFESCLRRCETCGVGISNARDGETFIHRNPLDNIPAEVRGEAIWTIQNALNIRNRGSKEIKFGFSTSEDALTWTVFSYLHREGLLSRVVSDLLPTPPTSEPVLLLWGCPVPPYSKQGDALCRHLVSILKCIGEDPLSYSEPDVIMDFGREGLVLIEVKYRSGNDRNTIPNKFAKYVGGTGAFRDVDAVVGSGFYELARNWRIGFDLSTGRAMILVNLAVASRSSEQAALSIFSDGLSQDGTHQFQQVWWSDFLGQFSLPAWLSEYTQRLGIR